MGVLSSQRDPTFATLIVTAAKKLHATAQVLASLTALRHQIAVRVETLASPAVLHAVVARINPYLAL